MYSFRLRVRKHSINNIVLFIAIIIKYNFSSQYTWVFKKYTLFFNDAMYQTQFIFLLMSIQFHPQERPSTNCKCLISQHHQFMLSSRESRCSIQPFSGHYIYIRGLLPPQHQPGKHGTGICLLVSLVS